MKTAPQSAEHVQKLVSSVENSVPCAVYAGDPHVLEMLKPENTVYPGDRASDLYLSLQTG